MDVRILSLLIIGLFGPSTLSWNKDGKKSKKKRTAGSGFILSEDMDDIPREEFRRRRRKILHNMIVDYKKEGIEVDINSSDPLTMESFTDEFQWARVLPLRNISQNRYRSRVQPQVRQWKRGLFHSIFKGARNFYLRHLNATRHPARLGSRIEINGTNVLLRKKASMYRHIEDIRTLMRLGIMSGTHRELRRVSTYVHYATLNSTRAAENARLDSQTCASIVLFLMEAYHMSYLDRTLVDYTLEVTARKFLFHVAKSSIGSVLSSFTHSGTDKYSPKKRMRTNLWEDLQDRDVLLQTMPKIIEALSSITLHSFCEHGEQAQSPFDKQTAEHCRNVAFEIFELLQRNRTQTVDLISKHGSCILAEQAAAVTILYRAIYICDFVSTSNTSLDLTRLGGDFRAYDPTRHERDLLLESRNIRIVPRDPKDPMNLKQSHSHQQLPYALYKCEPRPIANDVECDDPNDEPPFDEPDNYDYMAPHDVERFGKTESDPDFTNTGQVSLATEALLRSDPHYPQHYLNNTSAKENEYWHTHPISEPLECTLIRNYINFLQSLVKNRTEILFSGNLSTRIHINVHEEASWLNAMCTLLAFQVGIGSQSSKGCLNHGQILEMLRSWRQLQMKWGVGGFRENIRHPIYNGNIVKDVVFAIVSYLSIRLMKDDSSPRVQMNRLLDEFIISTNKRPILDVYE